MKWNCIRRRACCNNNTMRKKELSLLVSILCMFYFWSFIQFTYKQCWQQRQQERFVFLYTSIVLRVSVVNASLGVRIIEMTGELVVDWFSDTFQNLHDFAHKVYQEIKTVTTSSKYVMIWAHVASLYIPYFLSTCGWQWNFKKKIIYTFYQLNNRCKSTFSRYLQSNESCLQHPFISSYI